MPSQRKAFSTKPQEMLASVDDSKIAALLILWLSLTQEFKIPLTLRAFFSALISLVAAELALLKLLASTLASLAKLFSFLQTKKKKENQNKTKQELAAVERLKF